MEEKLPLVIVCLPSYNAEAFITETLSSLKNQTYPNFKVFISDDCSTDRTVPVIRSSIAGDKRFHLIQQTRNRGWIENTDLLLEMASKEGTYAFIMPHDDQIESTYIEKLVTVLEQNPSAILAFSDLQLHNLKNKKSRVIEYTAQQGVKKRKERVELLLKRKQMWWVAYRGMMRSCVIKKILPSQTTLFGDKDYSADWYFLVRLALYGDFIRLPEVLYDKYFFTNNLSFKQHDTRFQYFATFLTVSRIMINSTLHWKEIVIFQWVIGKQAIAYTLKVLGLHRLLRFLNRQ